MSQNKTPKIDFVITWVDGRDEEWLAEKRAFAEGRPPLEKPRFDSSDLRFRNDFDFLKYWFRGVENSPHGLIESSSSRPDISQTG